MQWKSAADILAQSQLDISKLPLKHNDHPSHRTRIEKFGVTRETCTVPNPGTMPAWIEFRLLCECGMSHTMTEEDKANVKLIFPELK
jgi:hypothetical protein